MTRRPIVRVGELEVRKRRWPLLVAVSYDGICHISTHNGVLRAKNERHKNVRDGHYVVTKCNRVLHYTVTRQSVPSNDADLCKRCGTRADFEAARAEYTQLWEEHRQEERQKDAERAIARQLERDRQQAVLEALYEALAFYPIEGVSWDPTTGKNNRNQRVIYLDLSTQLPGVITVGERDHAWPHLYRAVVYLELVPEDES